MGKIKMSSIGLVGLAINFWSSYNQKKQAPELAYLTGKGMGDTIAVHAEENKWPERIGATAGETIANTMKKTAVLDENGNLILK